MWTYMPYGPWPNEAAMRAWLDTLPPSEDPLFFTVVDRATGHLLEVFNPGRGMCAGAAVAPDGRTLYVLANSGSVYSIGLRF